MPREPKWKWRTSWQVQHVLVACLLFLSVGSTASHHHNGGPSSLRAAEAVLLVQCFLALKLLWFNVARYHATHLPTPLPPQLWGRERTEEGGQGALKELGVEVRTV